MELELKKERLETYEVGGEVTLSQEETTETIVPDYCPDIERIVATYGDIYLNSRAVHDGHGEVTGAVRISVLYVPEGESAIRTLEFSMPFTQESDGHLPERCVCLLADPEIEFLESRLLNPRKIFTQCKLITKLTGYQPGAVAFASDVEAAPEDQIQKMHTRENVVALTRILERDFTFAETLNLSPGREGASELLACRICPAVTETKILGGRIAFKGIFNVQALYRTPDGLCASMSSELPFSQMIEADTMPEDADVTVLLQLTGSDLQLDSGDDEGRQIDLTIYFHITALVREDREITLLRDLYSTACSVTCESVPMSVCTYFARRNRRQNVREMLEIGDTSASVVCISAMCAPVSVLREGEQAVLRTSVSVKALCRSADGTYMQAARTIEVTCPMECPEQCSLSAEARCPETIQGTVGDAGLEVRFPVDFIAEIAKSEKELSLNAVSLDPDAPGESREQPSLVLRHLGPGESPWSIAKANRTTVAAILEANLLENEEEITEDLLLLIPRKRT